MPRVRTLPTEEEVVLTVPKKRAPRKRVTPMVDEVADAPAPRPRARRPRTTPAPKSVEVTVTPEPVRRAPTPIESQRRAAKRGSRALVAVFTFFIMVAGTGVAIGMSDRGQIDVVAVVNERNERVERGEVREGENTLTIPVQNTSTEPNGGMIPADPSSIPPPPPAPAESASSTATSTPDGTATSTESGETTEAPEETSVIEEPAEV